MPSNALTRPVKTRGSVAFERSVRGVAATVGGPGREAKAENAGRDTEPNASFTRFSWLDDDSCAAGSVGPGGAALWGLKLASIVHRHHSSLTGAIILVAHEQS